MPMPLKSGGAPGGANFVANVRELMHRYHARGKIGTSKPASAAKANKQSVAIAYSKAREGLKGRT